MFRSNKTKVQRSRSTHGQQLVEVIVAVAITGFLAAMMGARLAQLLAMSTLSENQLKAEAVAQELLDRVCMTPCETHQSQKDVIQ